MQPAQPLIDSGLEFVEETTTVGAVVLAADVKAWHDWVSKALEAGISAKSVERHLVGAGWTSSEAAALITVSQKPVAVTHAPDMTTEVSYDVEQLKPPTFVPAKDGSRDVMVGAFILFLGLIVTAGTYAAAATSTTGGQYTVAWGAIVFGGLRVVRGLSV